MSVYITLDCRIIMDPAAFAWFCETRSIAHCADGPSSGPGQITVDACGDSIMLEADQAKMRGLELLPDLYKAAQAGQVDGAFMSAERSPNVKLEAAVFRNNELWAGWGDCFNRAVDIGPYAPSQCEYQRGLGRVDIGRRFRTLRVMRSAPTGICFCDPCRKRWKPGEHEDDCFDEDDDTAVDIATFMPAPAHGQLEQALDAAAVAATTYGRSVVGRLAGNATGPDQQHMFRRWLKMFKEATGERHVTWEPELMLDPILGSAAGLNGNLNFWPVYANNGRRQRGPYPAFVIRDPAIFPDTIRVPAHVDNVSLSDAAKLVVGGADPAEAVAVIAAITDPDRR